MSWGATGFTPIVTYNEPPFGFHEVITPTDFKRCNQDPYIGTEQLKNELNDRFRLVEKLREEEKQRTLAELCAIENQRIERFRSDRSPPPRRRGHYYSIVWMILIVIAMMLLFGGLK